MRFCHTFYSGSLSAECIQIGNNVVHPAGAQAATLYGFRRVNRGPEKNWISHTLTMLHIDVGNSTLHLRSWKERPFLSRAFQRRRLCHFIVRAALLCFCCFFLPSYCWLLHTISIFRLYACVCLRPRRYLFLRCSKNTDRDTRKLAGVEGRKKREIRLWEKENRPCSECSTVVLVWWSQSMWKTHARTHAQCLTSCSNLLLLLTVTTFLGLAEDNFSFPLNRTEYVYYIHTTFVYTH